jgi:endonuclease/exonuclease/phosphatase family metal-dependent hydrolase
MSASLPHPASDPSAFSIKVLTVNIHKGFTFFNRKFILPELREAVRKVGADVVFLQEVTGSNSAHPERFENYPETPHYEFLADSIWPQFAYGKNAVYDHGDHGNAVMSKFPIVASKNHDVSISGPERRGLLHCEIEIPGRTQHLHVVCVHLSLSEAHRTLQMGRLCALIQADIAPSASVVVAGDFNDWRNKAELQLARGCKKCLPAHRAGRPKLFRRASLCSDSTEFTCATRKATTRWCFPTGHGHTCLTMHRWQL